MNGYQQKYNQYTNGQFALVDCYYRNIWFVVNSEATAHALKKVFVSKISFIVIDLTTFTNFNIEENTIDTDVCFSWQTPSAKDPHNTSYSLIIDYNSTYTSDNFSSTELINEPVITMLDISKQTEVQDQMFLYKKILEEFNASTAIADQAQSRRTLNYYNVNKQGHNDFLAELDSIFLTELTLSDIENKLYHLALEYLGTFGTLPVLLLKLLDRSIYA